jgi:hypothetical protein
MKICQDQYGLGERYEHVHGKFLTISIQAGKSRPPYIFLGSLTGKRVGRRFRHPLEEKIRWAIVLIFATAFGIAVPARSQLPSNTGYSLAGGGTTTSSTLDPTYIRPTPSKTLRNFAFDAFGPYALTGAVLTAGLDQATDSPPEWQQGFTGYSERFGSDLGISVVKTSTRYGLAAALREDTSYYPCRCTGFFPRLRHAAISTLTARRGEDGHNVFSIPGLVAPYAGATAAVYGWYPNRYGAKDAFRVGNYSLLESVGLNIGLEFIYGGPHALFSYINRKNGPDAPVSGSKQ